ncbi:class I SAM-dependent methyltransferase [Streptomyces sp. ACA25]|uniref:class I SAM-dependent methyltransferase n=1 Tax=Streptomyces sp. ACA25 TaxID=3022596 RepID=UPI0023073CC8|nr:class I SAM-dependent methyltransferase [Streptomyces sp. ACA25]MDB1087493.1 class I SAM-dependent methyltransferase [Streptomyces sp. ACA25]
MYTQGPAAPADRLENAMRQGAGPALSGADPQRLTALADELDRVALLSMALTLRGHGLFTRDGAAHRSDDILSALRVASRHRRVVRRWLAALVRAEMLTASADGSYTGLAAVDAGDLDRAAAGMHEAGLALGHGPEMTRFLLDAVRYLPQLLRDEIALQTLLFPDGRMDTADSTYRENTISRYVNAMAAAALADFAAGRDARTPLRVLEVGAGVGGTTTDLVAALAPHAAGPGVDYLFTDVSRFFFLAARERLAALPWIRYRLFDMNGDAAAQGYDPASADVVVCANVLHNARHVGEVLAGLRRLLTPGGLLVVIETSREHCQLMTSMEFLMSPGPQEPDRDFEDFRRGQDRIFLTREEWLREIAGAGFESAVSLPTPEEPMARLGQHVHAAFAPTGGPAVTGAAPSPA